MRHASTIAIARTLLAQGRPDDVLRMIEPLDIDHVRDESDVLLHSIAARVHLLVHADPHRAQSRIQRAFSLPKVNPHAVAERHLWRGWLRAWPHREFFRPAAAMSDFHAAVDAASADHGMPIRLWSMLGGASLLLALGEPALADHLVREAGDPAWSRHDRDFRIWATGLSAAIALGGADLDAVKSTLDDARDAVTGFDAPLYHGRIRSLQTRLAVSQGATSATVDALADEALDLIRNGGRTYCPAAAELFLCRLDARIANGDHDEADAMLRAVPEDLRGLVAFDERLASRRDRKAGGPTRMAAALPTPPRRWPDGSSFEIPFWRSMPPLVTADAPILIVGERGTGKKYLAQQLHGTRGPFVVFDCAMPSPGDVALLLFGSQEKAGAIGEAGGGTLFLRNIDRVSLDVQRRLARTLREQRPELCIMASSALPLDRLAAGDTLSEELWEELGRIIITLPPLRERRSHIPILVADLIEKLRPRDLPLASVADGTLRALVAYDWPGNIRQLQNELERMLTLAESEPAPVIQRHDLPDAILHSAEADVGGDGVTGGSLDSVVAHAERIHIERILAQHGGHVSASADALGLTRQGLYKKMKRLAIDVSRFHSDDPSPVSN